MKAICETLTSRIYQTAFRRPRASRLIFWWIVLRKRNKFVDIDPHYFEVLFGEKPNKQLINDDEGNVLPEV